MRLAYSPYGISEPPPENHCLAFNGELWQAAFQGYLLGNGQRPFNPVLMRFMMADRMSPFGRGGLNTYAYCGGDPINNVDPSGHIHLPASLAHWINSKFGRTVFNARHRTPLRGLGIDPLKNPYELYKYMKNGKVGRIVESIPLGRLEDFMKAYPAQKRNILSEATRLAIQDVDFYSSATDISMANFDPDPLGNGRAVDDYKAVALVGSKLKEQLDSRRIPPRLQDAWRLDHNGEAILAILKRRAIALRTGRPIASDDWYADPDLYLYPRYRQYSFG
ncbi:RHS repeat-associated core domain-containing protein [Pseudomonas sp. SWRI51]|uniref:RHS repeat-associated core domain-containing protein n=1 Tax=Pseudomonas sp. SWRI51 TaxID=2745491 RepID=UPI001646B84F|nr:RHS repeat-associated core domain-containing protein [Pseudomonas sp. SWRI51]MBC3412961.1 RHS repeat-associated core domain-containing protein [Pseudomonas sp. SWRI51]